MWKTYKTVKKLKTIGGKLKGEFESLLKDFEEDMKEFDMDDVFEETFEMSSDKGEISATHEIHASGVDIFFDKVNVTAKTGWILDSLSYDEKINLYTAKFHANKVRINKK
jgi:hypothetical protein